MKKGNLIAKTLPTIVGIYVTCPNCGSTDYVCLGGRFFRCEKCGYQWNDDAINL